MFNFIKNLGSKSRKIKELEEKLEECGNKLVEKQEHINTTNAYYKKIIRQLKAKPKK